MHPFAAKCAVLTAGLLTCTPEIEISASGSYLLTGDLSLQWRAFAQKASAFFGTGLVRTAPVEWFSRSLAPGPVKDVSRLLYIGWFSMKFFAAGKLLRFGIIIHEKVPDCKASGTIFLYYILRTFPGKALKTGRREIRKPRQKHDEDRTQLRLAQQHKAQRENGRHHPIRIPQPYRAACPERVL